MINPTCFEKKWIEKFRGQKELRINPPLLEKMIHALYLLQNLQQQDLSFIFKGGTSLILLLENTRRFSVDIDIVLDKKYESATTKKEVEEVLDKTVQNSHFTGWTLDERRSYKEGIPKAHYKLAYQPNYDPAGHILLDILFDKSFYPHLIEVPIQTRWIESSKAINVSVPDIDSITGDKLTAFAPNTTGIRYESDKAPEIIKQLFDIGNLFEKISDVETVAESFNAFAKEEIAYRGLNINADGVLSDIIETARTIALRDKNTSEPFKSNFAELQNGMRSFAPYLFSGSFHLDDAIAASAKAAYLASKILMKGYSALERYQNEDITSLVIEDDKWNFLNKLKRLPDKSAFYYWYKTVELLNT